MNPVNVKRNPSTRLMFKAIIKFMMRDKRRVPDKPVPNLKLDLKVLNDNNKTPKVTWLGHSSLIITLDGITILTDPALSERAAPFSFSGPKRFPYQYPYSPDDLPACDILLISHDHYDHLDHKTIIELNENKKFKKVITTLGVGAHLEKWGVDPEAITELDWWESTDHSGITFTAAPTTHFSGRGPGSMSRTLWASFIIRSQSSNIFFGGDSGYFKGFKEIGERFGPFDLTLLECGQYGEAWPHIHMMPEETAQAHADLNGKALLPIHWGKFSLSLHSWEEPVERLMKAAEKMNINVITPRIGQTFDLSGKITEEKWWQS
jgi:L-ascorbate metabolism protein UlaG (beta-lactamase superfamily)